MSTAVTLTGDRTPQTTKILAAGALSLLVPPFAIVFAPAILLSIVAGVLAVKWGMDELNAIELREVPQDGKVAVMGGMGAGVGGILFAISLVLAYFGLIAALVGFIVFMG